MLGELRQDIKRNRPPGVAVARFVQVTPPDAVVISGPRHAGAIAVEQVELPEAVADEIGIGGLRFLGPDGLCGIAQHKVDQGRRVEAARQDHDRAVRCGKAVVNPGRHIGLARDRAVALHVPRRARHPDVMAIGADI